METKTTEECLEFVKSYLEEVDQELLPSNFDFDYEDEKLVFNKLLEIRICIGKVYEMALAKYNTDDTDEEE